MNETVRHLKLFRFWIPVLLASFVLGVVGIQVVLIAHTHKMITGQPLLHGRDHHDLSHLPPLFLSKSRPDDEELIIVPFASLSEDDNCYVILMDAPGISLNSVTILLQGRELAIQSRSPAVWEKRFRLPGPVSSTGPPTPQLCEPGRLRILVRKAEAPPEAESGLSLL